MTSPDANYILTNIYEGICGNHIAASAAIGSTSQPCYKVPKNMP